MFRYIILSIFLFSMSPAYAQMNTFSEGYRMGQLTKYSVKGFLSKTGEGEVQMGNESTPWIVTSGSGKDQKVEQKNPWAFSSDTATYNKYRPLVGEYVVVRYRQLQFRNPTDGDTDYRVEEIVAVDPSKAPVNACVSSNGGSGAKSDGDRVGRIVKVSTKGSFSKSFEVIMQVGNGGGQFIEMSISSQEMYDCAVNALKSGKKMKVTYNQSFLRNALVRDSSYDIVAITPIKSLE